MNSKKAAKQEDKAIKRQEKRGGGRGTHGSLTKAGKVREQTPRIEKTSQKKSTHPLTENRARFRRMDYKEKHKNDKRPYNG